MVTFRNRAKSAPAALPMPIKQVNGHTRGEASPTTPRFPETSPATCRARAGCFSFPGQANRHVRHRRRTAEGGGGRFHHPAHRSRPRPNAGYMLPDLPGTTPDASWLFPLPGKRGSKQRHLPMQWEKGNPWPFRPGHPVQGVPSQAHCWHVPGAFPPPLSRPGARPLGRRALGLAGDLGLASTSCRMTSPAAGGKLSAAATLAQSSIMSATKQFSPWRKYVSPRGSH